MYERFTERARKVMQLANQEAQRFNHEYIGTEHILLGLISEGSGVGANVLLNLGVDLEKVRQAVERKVKSGPEMITMGKLPQTPRAKKVILFAVEEMNSLAHSFLGTEHLLLGLLREQDGVAVKVLTSFDLSLQNIREEVVSLLGAEPPGFGQDRPTGKGKRLQKKSRRPRPAGSRDLLQHQKCFPTNVELEQSTLNRIWTALARARGNNVVLIGEHAHGHEYVLGMAGAIATGAAPETLGKHSLYSISWRGLQTNIDDFFRASREAGNIIMAVHGVPARRIRRLHFGKRGRGANDVDANLFSDPVIKFVFTANPHEWNRQLKSHPDFADLCQPITLPDCTRESTCQIVKRECTQLELVHIVTISDEAIQSAVEYGHDRSAGSGDFPATFAIDLLDQVATQKKLFQYPELNEKLAKSFEKLQTLAPRITRAVQQGSFAKAKEIEGEYSFWRAKFVHDLGETELPVVDAKDVRGQIK